MGKASENCPMCANEFNGDVLKFPQMKLTEIKTIANSNTMNNGFDDENEEGEDNNEDYVNGEAVNGNDESESNQKGPMSADSNSSNATNGSGSRPDSNKT